MKIKRSADADGNVHPKRQKIETASTRTTVAETEMHEIRSSRDLQLLLAFDQDIGPVPRQKIQSFRSFLASIAYAAEGDDTSARRRLLLTYLQSQTSPEGKEASAFLGDLIKTWHFAAQSNTDSLFSSVVAVLALLLKTIASLVDFREYGNRLCAIVLHDDQVQLLDRGLGSHKAKEYLITPCLQLLTEVAVFDGGHAASTLYRQREITFRRLDVFLGMRKDIKGDNVKGSKRRSVRETALGYLFANLRLQTPAAKMHIISQGKVLRALLDDVVEDSSIVILEILEVLRRDVAMDCALSHTAKGRFFNQWTLGRLTTLYGYNESVSLPGVDQHVQRSVHDFLLFLCTSPGCGLVQMRPASKSGVHAVRLGVTSKHNDDKDRPAGGETKLQQFLQTLKPYASAPQCELILAVFRSLPELVPGYFSSGKTFSLDPKLTTTWIGYSSFVLAAILIPLPGSLGSLGVHDAVPPLYGTIMDSIIPKPCTQKILTRCLNQSVNLVKLFTFQILNAAFEKFAKVLQLCEDMQRQTNNQKIKVAWYQGVSKLRDDFCGRVPELRHVISQFHNCPKESTILRERTTRLIALYYKVIPQVAQQEKFDISVSLSIALMDVESSDESHEQKGISLLELEHLLEIAHRSPNMQWWHKPESMTLSPFTMLLRLYLDRVRAGAISEHLRTLLNAVATESQILRSNTSRPSLDALVLSLQDSEDWKASGRVFEFLDHCILHLVRRPVHYYDMLVELKAAAKLDVNLGDYQVDLLLIAIMDQWRFMVESADAPTVTNVSIWLVRFIEEMNLTNDYHEKTPVRDRTTKLLSQIHDRLKPGIQDVYCHAMFERVLVERSVVGTLGQLVTAKTINETGQISRLVDPPLEAPPKLEVALPSGPEEEHEDHPGLHRWTRHKVQEAITEGHVKALILCLCSKYVGIRKQALTGVRAFMTRLKASGYSEWQQTYILAGEIIETAANVIANGPLPYYAGVLAADLFSVLSDPLHLMYAKVNEFLNKGPEWNVRKLPSYWMDKILMKPPTDDEGLHQETEWLLDGLIGGLRTSADMDIYRKCHMFERLMSCSASPSLPEPCFQKTLDLLFRCTYVEGSSTLITRCGLISWIASCLAIHSNNDLTGGRLRLLASRAYETSDQERIDDWAKGSIVCTLDSLQITQR